MRSHQQDAGNTWLFSLVRPVSTTREKDLQVSVDGNGWIYCDALGPETEDWVTDDGNISPCIELLASQEVNPLTDEG